MKWTYAVTFTLRCHELGPWDSKENAGGMVMKPAVIRQTKRVERKLCHSGTLPKPTSICIYGDKPSFEPLSG